MIKLTDFTNFFSPCNLKNNHEIIFFIKMVETINLE